VASGEDDKKKDASFSRTTGSYPRPTLPPQPWRRPTPAPMSLPPLPPEPHDDHNAARGAKNVITRCLCVTPGERVHLLSFHAEALYGLMAQTVEEAGAEAVRVDISNIEPRGTTHQDYSAILAPLLAGATATVLLAPQRPSAALSLAIAKTAESVRSRHLHLLQVDERLLGQSVRADPDLLAIVNSRLSSAVKPPCVVKVTSETGSELEVQLSQKHPILTSSGRPTKGTSENLPAGSVFTHPARVTGTLIVDRAVFGPGVNLDRSLVRKAPTRVVFENGRIKSFDASDPTVAQTFETYLASHANADRVGLLVFPTNYLVRSEVGIDRQDMLLPGMSVSLGFASADTTRASYEAPVQMVLLGRRQTVEVNGRKLVDGGRFDHALVEGIDPFR
jgi:aminopeptidase